MPSSSGGFPAATSFCIELRDTGGTLSKNRMKLAGSNGVPLAVATALNPYVGYDRATEIVQEATRSGPPLREVAREKGVSEAVLDEALDLRKMALGGG